MSQSMNSAVPPIWLWNYVWNVFIMFYWTYIGIGIQGYFSDIIFLGLSWYIDLMTGRHNLFLVIHKHNVWVGPFPFL